MGMKKARDLPMNGRTDRLQFKERKRVSDSDFKVGGGGEGRRKLNSPVTREHLGGKEMHKRDGSSFISNFLRREEKKNEKGPIPTKYNEGLP